MSHSELKGWIFLTKKMENARLAKRNKYDFKECSKEGDKGPDDFVHSLKLADPDKRGYII